MLIRSKKYHILAAYKVDNLVASLKAAMKAVGKLQEAEIAVENLMRQRWRTGQVSCRRAGPVRVSCDAVGRSCCCNVLSKSALKAQLAEIEVSRSCRRTPGSSRHSGNVAV